MVLEFAPSLLSLMKALPEPTPHSGILPPPKILGSDLRSTRLKGSAAQQCTFAAFPCQVQEISEPSNTKPLAGFGRPGACFRFVSDRLVSCFPRPCAACQEGNGTEARDR